ncbi:unnamed protein product [Dovyalis caffra]|uniref:HVA22-like protein n=1 Tax=Dovyalis caffra TaxID=77055 RepID=A0AAV1R9C0_9ROSI|nr:unnamed protein product [Dovyalis caffra]
MIGSFLSRTLLMIFGYAYPAYECFKKVEKNSKDIEQLLFWCRYWILVAVLTVCERVGDHLISWLPMYSEAKLGFFMYLWHPKTRVRNRICLQLFFRPFMAKHETEIDRNLLELRMKAEKIAHIYRQKAAAYGQKKFFEILQYVSSQSASLPHSDQQEGPNAKNGEPYASSSISETTTEKQPEEHQLHSSSSASLSQQSHEPASTELEEQPSEPMLSLENGDSDSPRQETVSKESVQLKHGRWKLFQSPQKPSKS